MIKEKAKYDEKRGWLRRYKVSFEYEVEIPVESGGFCPRRFVWKLEEKVFWMRSLTDLSRDHSRRLKNLVVECLGSGEKWEVQEETRDVFKIERQIK